MVLIHVKLKMIAVSHFYMELKKHLLLRIDLYTIQLCVCLYFNLYAMDPLLEYPQPAIGGRIRLEFPGQCTSFITVSRDTKIGPCYMYLWKKIFSCDLSLK